MAFAGAVGEEQEQAAQRRILARRQRDEERRIRLLNARERLMGVDTASFEQMIREKEAKKAAEKSADKLYANTNQAIRNILEEEHMRVEEEKAARHLETQAAWDVQMENKEHTITFELNDPNRFKKDQPARVGDFDPRCGASSMQIFGGEDLRKGDRVKMQQMQLSDWTAQQLNEKNAQRVAQKEEEMKYAEYLAQIEQVREDLEKAELERKEEMKIEQRVSNDQLSSMRAQQRNAEREARLALEKRNTETVMNDRMLRETRDQGASRIPGRIRPDHWKGMTTTQLAEIQQIQQQQILEKRARVEAERKLTRAEASVSDSVVDILQHQYDAEQARVAEERLRYSQELLVQARQKKARDAEQRELLGSNKITDGFFNRFGSSCR